MGGVGRVGVLGDLLDQMKIRLTQVKLLLGLNMAIILRNFLES